MFNSTFTADDSKTPSPTGTLQLEGCATIEFCNELRSALIEALNKTESLVVDVSRITELDVSGLQIFCSARRSVIKRQKAMVLADKISDAFSEAVLDAGFNRTYTSSCWLNSGTTCLWGDCKQAGKETAP